MTKAELIKAMAEGGKVSNIQAGNALEAAIQAIVAADTTKIKGLGTFEWRTRKARTCRNPMTGESVDVPESTTLHFKASKSLRNL